MALTDVEIVAILAVALIITGLNGTYWKPRILKRYAHWFEDKFSPTAKVRSKSFGHAGLRIKCEMNNPSDGYKELEFALSLGARENLVYYPYKLVARDSDKLNCWATLTDPVKFQVRSRGRERKRNSPGRQPALRKSRSPNSASWATRSIQRAQILRTDSSRGAA